MEVSGGKSATVAVNDLAMEKRAPRPSGLLGIFTSIYLAQGLFLPAQTGIAGIDAALAVLQKQEQPLGDDTFQLLEQLGSVLSVDVIDMLNRSSNRIEALDRYLESLGNILINADRRSQELAASLVTLTAAQKKEKTNVNTLQTAINKAIQASDYADAGSKNGELMKAQTALSETELKIKQTTDIQAKLKKLIDLGKQRKATIEKNREIILSGLTVTDIPGLTNLGLVKSGSTKSKSTGGVGL